MLRSEALWTQPREECPEPGRWHSPDEYATEDEVTRFLAALCVLLRPRRVLETGTYRGDTAEAMGKALMGYGELESLEVDPSRATAARARVRGLPVSVINCHSLQWPVEAYDLMFFDSDPVVRPQEMRRFARPGAVWALHDARWPEVQESLRQLRTDGVIDCWTYLPTPRGLALGRYP